MNRVSLNQCAQCGADLIAAAWSEHVTDSCVRNVWSCEACGYQFEDTVYLSAREAAEASQAPSSSGSLAMLADPPRFIARQQFAQDG